MTIATHIGEVSFVSVCHQVPAIPVLQEDPGQSSNLRHVPRATNLRRCVLLSHLEFFLLCSYRLSLFHDWAEQVANAIAVSIETSKRLCFQHCPILFYDDPISSYFTWKTPYSKLRHDVLSCIGMCQIFTAVSAFFEVPHPGAHAIWHGKLWSFQGRWDFFAVSTVSTCFTISMAIKHGVTTLHTEWYWESWDATVWLFQRVWHVWSLWRTSLWLCN